MPPLPRRLASPRYLSFPFAVGPEGPRTSLRAAHVREQIQQTIFTNPGERVFRPDFGGGANRLVFEPNERGLWELTRQRISAALKPVLEGEVDPATLVIDVGGDAEVLTVTVSYRLAAINQVESHEFLVDPGAVRG
jgi:phage baseplate assembly protein W